jgi:adenine nucleotide transporter 17
MYNGLLTSCLATAASDFVYFYFYHYFKSPHPITNLCVRCLSGITNTLLTTPLWVAVHRIRSTQHVTGGPTKLGLIGMIQSIVSNEGLLALWQGTAASLLLVANPVIHHFTNDALKRWWCRRPKQQLGRRQWQQHRQEKQEKQEEDKRENGMEVEQQRQEQWQQQQEEEEEEQQPHQRYQLRAAHYFCFGAIAKCIATLCTFPLQVAQARSRERSSRLASIDSTSDGNTVPGSGGAGFIHELFSILRTEGVQGWFKGLQTTVLNTVLNAAFAQAQYEAILCQLQARPHSTAEIPRNPNPSLETPLRPRSNTTLL